MPALHMTDDDLLRYSRHLLLDDIGIEGQRRLLDARALVVGAGGLGSPVALFLGSAGVGRVTLVDGDRVDLTNLQRQIAHDLSTLGEPKAISAALRVAGINPRIDITALTERVDGERLAELVATADIVIDCTDNFATRHAVNAACVRHGKPLVAGAAIVFDGQVSVYDTRSDARRATPAPFPPTRPSRTAALDHGRVRRRWSASSAACGGGSAEAPRRHRQLARRPLQMPTRERWNGRAAGRARPRLPGLRRPAAPLGMTKGAC